MRYLRCLLLIVVSVFVLNSCTLNDGPIDPSDVVILDRPQAKAAFEYLNKIRANPSAYSDSIGVNLSDVKALHALTWNEILQKVAEDKAKDLADRNYFAHVDPDGYGINYYMDKAGYPMRPEWLDSAHYNFFESLAANSTKNISGEQFIDQLIIDYGVPDLGHRKHLLGMDSWFASQTECGVAIARKLGTTYVNYFVYIIAKPGAAGITIIAPVVIS